MDTCNKQGALAIFKSTDILPILNRGIIICDKALEQEEARRRAAEEALQQETIKIKQGIYTPRQQVERNILLKEIEESVKESKEYLARLYAEAYEIQRQEKKNWWDFFFSWHEPKVQQKHLDLASNLQVLKEFVEQEVIATFDRFLTQDPKLLTQILDGKYGHLRYFENRYRLTLFNYGSSYIKYEEDRERYAEPSREQKQRFALSRLRDMARATKSIAITEEDVQLVEYFKRKG